MFGNFLKHYGKKKFKDGVNSLNDAIVSFDPEGATEAAIGEMEENFDKINREFSSAKQEWSREQSEADQITKLFNQRMSAAEHIQGQIDADPDNTTLTAGLDQLLSALEDMNDDVMREVEEAADAKEMMNELDETVKMYATKLKSARSDMKKAANSMKKAKMQEERAEAKAERAAQSAGLSSSVSGLSSALESMNRQASDAQANADAAKRKADLLGPAKVDDNAAVAAAMNAVNGVTPTGNSVKDRMAALRNK